MIEESKTPEERADAWLKSGDTCVASCSLYVALRPAHKLGPFSPMAPYWVSCFGRCHALLEAVPEWRERLCEVPKRFSRWEPHVRQWDELTRLYLAGGTEALQALLLACHEEAEAISARLGKRDGPQL